MKKFYQVTEIEFDWDDTYCAIPDEFTQECIIEDTLDFLWDAKDEEHLMSLISDDVGYCVKSIEYELV
ncbi:hypothetical protein [Synechococcus phage S-B43]|jgi:hypothetical protein|nr:hypothetical protein [Synechococcus phage S-B43]